MKEEDVGDKQEMCDHRPKVRESLGHLRELWGVEAVYVIKIGY